MGYFSEMDFMNREETEWSNPSNVQQLRDQIEYLNESLIDLDGQFPRDMCDPEFDRMFYAECLTEVHDDADTVQGVLQAIRKTEDQLRIAKEEERRAAEGQSRRMDWESTVLETGATPDYQIVLLSVFFPAADPSAAA